MKTIYWPVCLTFIALFGCNQVSEYSTNRKDFTSQKESDIIACTPGNSSLEMGKIQTGLKGFGKGHYLKTGLQNKWHVIVDGFNIIPLVGLRNWSVFLPHMDSAMVMGDIITNQINLPSIQQEVAAHGLAIADIHQYPARDGSVILFMHIKGFGNNTTLSQSLKTLLAKLKAIGDTTGKEERLNTVIANSNKARLDSIIGYKGEVDGDVYKYNISRLDVFEATGIPASTFLEFNTWAAWQGTEENAVVAGDFMMLKDEVGPVIKALAENGFELVHNQLVYEEPGIYCLHYWGFGNAEKLAKGLKAGLDLQNKR